LANAAPQYLGGIHREETTMADTTLHEQGAGDPIGGAPAQAECEECIGSGGWYRYEPALDPAPGRLYLSCLQCRGSGRTAPARG
jgi:hypothetical protein